MWRHIKCMFNPYMNNKDSDQPAHPHRLIRAFSPCKQQESRPQNYLSIQAHKPCSIAHLFSEKGQGVFIGEGAFIIIITICKGFRKRNPV